ncbi:NAD(P)-binding protein [Durotheca rogersii]|uniref:NAD(P)-binding protein n=1 Tax=Durotheca rogersii TaxID=419775 RepID=UPI00221FFAF5|nr:NAD(P)-binding protein [Durotheca rogersii]KAI5855553.1 NAD(P)-binding protein [Durotheca rogersii]
MLVLVTGATGNIGRHVISSLLARGHRVRALARSPSSSFSSDTLSRLESVVPTSGYDDVAALDRGCAGVDAIVNAYSGKPELTLEGQLLLLRAAERAGVKRFVASSWSYDWTALQLGQHESYDPFIAFRNHVELTSEIRPIYILTGVFAEVFFAVPGHGDFTPRNHGCWDPQRRRLEIWGTGDEPWQWTTEKDAAEIAAEIVQRDDAAEGGFWRVCSGVNTLREIAATYERVRETKVDVEVMGDVAELREQAMRARRNGSRRNFWPYIGWFYQLFTVDGTWTLTRLDNEKLGVPTTTLEQFLREHPTL